MMEKRETAQNSYDLSITESEETAVKPFDGNAASEICCGTTNGQ